MPTKWRVVSVAYARIQLTLAGTALVAAACAAASFCPPFVGERPALGAGIALLVPLNTVTIVRSICLRRRAKGIAKGRKAQWRAVRSLPRRMQLTLGALGITAAALLVTGPDSYPLYADDADENGYFAVDRSRAHRPKIQVTKSRYEALQKAKQRTAFAALGFSAVIGAGLTLITPWSDEQAGLLPPRHCAPKWRN
ncbi:hypothetical protein [Streptomyces sp. NPDC056069]|uniref:hypothetical protein n=1 Tax=Streptomyces sp. NPDC056069 TaxID=3345702 RepID=UPI0035D73F70